MVPRAAELIARLGLVPHPEGGHFRELYRSATPIDSRDGRGVRTALTTIAFLLSAGSHSRWHRVTSDEAWHFYEGDALELLLMPPDGAELRRVRLGHALTGDGPVVVVPAGWWQAARPSGSYALVGCTVAPGFDFADFSFLRDDPEMLGRLRRLEPDIAALA